MIKGFTYSLNNALRFVVLFIVCVSFFTSCSKPQDDPIPIVPPVVNPPSTVPSGVIDNFSIDDTLIGFNTSTFARWLVTGSNSLTTVTFGGNPVGVSGPYSTGRLKKDSLFVLLVNTGQKRSQMVHVADSITTKLNNGGMQMEKIKSEYYIDSTKSWKDTLIDPQTKGEKLLFKFNGYTTVVDSLNNSSEVRFYVVDSGTQPGGSNPGSPPVIRFRGVLYTIVNFTVQSIQVTYDYTNVNNVVMRWRDTFLYK